MDRQKMIVYGLIVGGVLLALVSLLADTLGIGGSEGFGYFQIIGLVVGIVAAAAGVYLGFIRKAPPAAP